MRVVINQRLVRRSRRIAQYSFFVTLAILVAGLFVTNATPATNNPLLLLAPLIVLPIAMAATVYSVRMANLWLREPRTEDVLQRGLKGISNRSVLYHYALPARHVLVAPQGVFTFTVRPQDGRFRVDGTNWTREGGAFSKFMRFFRQDNVGNPHRDALRDAAAIQQLVDQVAPESGVTVQPVIVFTSPQAEVEVSESPIPVVHADTKKRPSLKTYLRDVKKENNHATLSAEQIEALERAARIDPEAMA